MSAKLPIPRISSRQWVIVLSTFALLIVYQTYVGFLQPYDMRGDQYNIGIVVLKQIHPELFVRDYVFKDTALFQFYTPSFVTTIKWLTKLTGSYDSYEMALALLIPVVMSVYLAGMFALLYFVTRNVWVALFVSTASSWLQKPISSLWGVAGLPAIMARNFFFPFVPWLFLLLFRWLDNSRWWQLPLLALLGGLGANLHPVSGFVFVQLLLSMILLAQGLNRKTFANLLLSALAALAGASPMLVNYFGGVGYFFEGIDTDITSAPFAVYYQVMHERIRLFPYDAIRFFGHQLSPAEQEIAVWVYLLGLLLCGIMFLLLRYRRPSWLSERMFWGCFFTCQVPMAYLLTRFDATVLVVITIAYWGLQLSKSRADRLDRWILYLMALVCCYSFVACYFLDAIWKHFELWQLTDLVVEQIRASRFIFLPLFLYAARFMHIATEQLPSGVGILFAVSTACLIVLAPGTLAWALLVGLLLLTWCYGQRWIEASKWLGLVFNIATWTLIIRVTFLILMTPARRAGWLALGLAAGCNLLVFRYRHSYRRRWQTAIGVGLATLVFTSALGVPGSRLLLSTWLNDFASAPFRLWARVSPKNVRQIPKGRQDAFELYDWARTHTKVDSLFYYDSLEFRFQARRSLTHCWKDLGVAYFHGPLIVKFYNRYQKLQRAYGDQLRLLSYAHEYQVDYIVTTHAQGIKLNLPVAFENSTYVIYELRQRDDS